MRQKSFLLLLGSFIFTSLTQSIRAQSLSDTSGSLQQVKALATDHYLKSKALIIPASFLAYGSLKPVINGIATLDQNIMSHTTEPHSPFIKNAPDYLMWAPSAFVFILDATKVKMKHSVTDHLLLEGSSILITGGIGLGMRLISKNIKVYKESDTKFPSGHTANAFRGAEIFHQELKEDHPLISYAGYVVAAGVGLMRMKAKQHYLSEVIAGAGLGILSTKITYWFFQKIKKQKR